MTRVLNLFLFLWRGCGPSSPKFKKCVCFEPQNSWHQKPEKPKPETPPGRFGRYNFFHQISCLSFWRKGCFTAVGGLSAQPKGIHAQPDSHVRTPLRQHTLNLTIHKDTHTRRSVRSKSALPVHNSFAPSPTQSRNSFSSDLLCQKECVAICFCLLASEVHLPADSNMFFSVCGPLKATCPSKPKHSHHKLMGSWVGGT